MKSIRMVFSLLILFFLAIESRGEERFRVVTWNVENLFDCHDDTLKEDNEFMPESVRQWTWGRYWRKIDDLSRAVMAIGGDAPPALVALQEVENDSVLRDLTCRGPLYSLHYEYVMTDGPDVRGINVALMFQSTVFRLLGHETFRVPSVEHGLRPTRDILHAWGRLPNCDTLHVIVCHFPSRAGGHKDGTLNRQLAAQTLSNLLDSLDSSINACRLLVMGDFNATLRDKVFQIIRVKSIKNFRNQRDSSQCRLIALTPDNRRPKHGTYRFQGNWSWLDHVLVSPSLLMSGQSEAKALPFVQPWMQRKFDDGNWYPRRTYLGPVYQGGVSDHLPVFADFFF